MRPGLRELGGDPYLRICIAIVLAVFVTLLVLSFVLYVNFQAIVTTKTVTLVRANLNQLSESTGQTLASVEKTLVQAYFDDTVQRFGFNRPPEAIDQNRGLDQLEKYRFVSSTIQSLYVLNRTTQTVYIASDYAGRKVEPWDDFFDQGVLTELKNYRYDRPFMPVPRRLPSGDIESKRGETYNGISLVFYDAVNPVAAGTILVANLDQALFRERLAKMEQDVQGTSLIADARDLLLASRPEDGARWNHDLAPFLANLRASPDAGTRLLDVAGQPAILTWTGPDKNQWRYLSVVPLNRVTADLESLRSSMIVSAFLILLAGSAFSVLSAWFLYKPIRQTLERVSRLEQESLEGRDALRDRVLRRILTEPVRDSGGALTLVASEDLGGFPLMLSPESPCRVVLLRIDRFRQVAQDYGPSDLPRLRAALTEAARQALAVLGPAEAVDLAEDSVAVLVGGAAEPGDERLGPVLRGLQAQAEASWKLTLTCAWSDRGDGLAYAPFLYRQAQQNSFLRFFRGHGQLISPMQAATQRREDYVYPAAKEKLLIEALMLRNLAGARQHYREIIATLSDYPQTTVNLAHSHLALGLAMALDTIRSHWFSDIPFHFDTVVNLGDFETVEELDRTYDELFEGVITLMNTRRHHRQNDLVSRVNEIIERDFADPNLSLDAIADQLALTATHVSRAYRKTCLKAIPEVILEARLARSKMLLGSTALTVSQVAEASGFRNANYFHTLFRKVEGQTPAEFRKQPV